MDDESVRLLRSIDRRLALLTVPQERDVREKLDAEVLRTEARMAMFEAIDGKRGSPELALSIGASERAVQMFVKDLADLGLVRAVGKAGRGNVVEKDEEGIVRWYLHRPRENGAG